jgi:type VI secretion system protein ImpJ
VLSIARVRGADYQLDREYLPPCLNAACASVFWDELLQSLLDQMVLLSHQLSLQRSERSKLIADFTDTDIQRFWVLDIVNRAVPELQHIINIRHVHPEELYRFLISVGGALCTFCPEYQVTAFPAYDHRSLGSCLTPVAMQVRRMLENVTFKKRRCQPIDLKKVKNQRNSK